MLSYRIGQASSSAVARDLAAYYAGEQTMASYYGKAGELRADLSDAMADRLGVDRNRPVTAEEMSALMLGLRADGRDIEGRARRSANAEDGKQARVTFADFTFSASKSLSVAVALAPDADERAALIGIHHAAVAGAMAHLESQIAFARRGRGGRNGAEPGQLAWVAFDHFTARPTPDSAPDPQLHSHIIVPNTVLTASGHVGSLDLNKLAGRVKEFGAIYQAYLARGLREAGASVRLGAGGEAELSAVPRKVTAAFSVRHELSDAEARRIAARDGLKWDALSPEQQIVRRRAAMMATRQAKQEGEPAEAEWRQRAERLGYTHRSVLGTHPRPEAEPAQRHDLAYEVSAPLLSREFQHNATLPVGRLREIAARGLVAAGIGDRPADDIAAVVTRFQERGIRQDSQTTRVLVRGQSATTELTADQEGEAITLARAAAADQGAGVKRPDMDRAKAEFLATRPQIDRDSEQWRQQEKLIDHLASGPRLTLAVGAAGAGKSTILGPLVSAWQHDGRDVHGATLAWRQAGDLAEAGIAEDHRSALHPFLRRAQSGDIHLTRNSVVVVDEVGLIGTRQALELLRLQDKHGFAIVAVGDDKQTRAVEAGSGIALLRRALGEVPEIATTVRQRSERDRQTATLWREGKAAAALKRLGEDGGLHLAEGRDATIAKAAELRNGQDRPLFIVPSNADARDLGMEIRRRRQAAGEIGPDAVTVHATDRAGTFDLPIAAGDRVRFFDRVHDANHDGKRKVVASNGDVCAVMEADQGGLVVRNERTGASGRVVFDRIRDQETGAVRISTGEAATIHTSQGATVDSAVFVLPSGSAGLDGFRSYVGASRHRDRVQLVVDGAAERDAIRLRRPLGDRSEITDAQVIANMAGNLGRQGERELATAMLERTAKPVSQAQRDAARANASPRATHRAHQPQAPYSPRHKL